MITSPQEPAVASVASVNGQPLHLPEESLGDDALRQRAYTELLRQRARQTGLLDESDEDGPDGVISAAAARAIDALLEREVQVPEPDEAACRRYHAAQQARYSTGEQVRARHILFCVTDGVNFNELRKVAEQALLDLRAEPERFAEKASALSNCPTGAAGGELGWLRRDDCVDEFARELFGQMEVGVLPRLVHSRYGLHVVEVLERRAGEPLPFDAVRGAVGMTLRQQSFAAALRQYLQLLAAEANVLGIELEACETPLVR